MMRMVAYAPYRLCCATIMHLAHAVNRTGIAVIVGLIAAPGLVTVAAWAAPPATVPQPGEAVPALDFRWAEWQTRHNGQLLLRRAMLMGDPGLSRRVDDAIAFHAEFRSMLFEGRQRQALAIPTNKVTNLPGLSTPLVEYDFIASFRGIRFRQTETTFREFFGTESYEWALWVNNVAEAYRSHGDAGDVEKAIGYFKEAEQIIIKAYEGLPNPDQANIHANLALAESELLHFDAARRGMIEALETLKRTVGTRHALFCLHTTNLAELCRKTGDLPTARKLLNDNIARLDAIAEPYSIGERIDLLRTRIFTLNALANLEEDINDHQQARRWLDRDLVEVIKLEALMKTDPTDMRALCLIQLANLAANGDELDLAALDRADQQADEATAIILKLFGQDHPRYAEALLVHSRVLLRRSDPAKRDLERRFYFRETARKILSKQGAGPAAHLQLFTIDIQDLLRDKRFDEAERTADQWVKEARALLGETAPEVAGIWLKIAITRMMAGHPDRACEAVDQSLALARRHLDLTLAAHSELQQLQMARDVRAHLDVFLSLHRAAGMIDQDAYGQILSIKGAVFTRQRLVRAARDPADTRSADLLTRLRGEVSLLQSLTQTRAQHGPDPSLDARLTRLNTSVGLLQSELSTALDQKSALHLAGPDQLRSALPEGVALIDFIRFFDTRPPAPGKDDWDERPRYLAMISTRNQLMPVEFDDKIDANVIDAAIADWRKNQLFDAEAGLRLRKMLWAPIEPRLQNIKVILISPDGALNMLPFAALPDEPAPGRGPAGSNAPLGRLIDRYAFATVPVPALLPSLMDPKAARPGKGALLVGGIDFNHAIASTPPTTQRAVMPIATTQAGGFGPLPGAAEEIRVVSAEFTHAFGPESVRTLSGAAATKSALWDAVRGRRFVHLATHGFFNPQPALPATRPANSSDAMAGALANAPLIVDPGLLSGIGLSGANLPSRMGEGDLPEPNQGLLTAAEVEQGDLSGVQTVVLSACETGLGTSSAGEGLLGLQRSFQMAGARTVVASLWKVDDQRTRELMISFYDKLIARGRPPILALRQAQREVLHSQSASDGRSRAVVVGGDSSRAGDPSATASHPTLWAAWILSGDPGDLNAAMAQFDVVDPPPAADLAAVLPPAADNGRAGWGVPLAAALALAIAIVLVRRRFRVKTTAS